MLKIGKAIQNLENGVVWGNGSPEVTGNGTI